MKKLLATVLTLTMLVAAMGITAFAAYDYDATIENTIAVDFEYVSEAEGEVLYNIVLSAAEDIQELNTADLTFKLIKDVGEINYEILKSPTEDIEINRVAGDRYEFHYKEGNEAVENDIVIGQVRFSGYGQFDFYVDTTANATNLVTATTVYNNIVTEFSADGSTDGELDLSGVDGDSTDDNITDEVIAITTRALNIEVAFPNIVDFNAAVYQDMKIEVTGGLVEETFDLGNAAEDKVATPDDTNDDVVYGAETSDYTLTAGTTTVSLEETDGTPTDVEVNAYLLALELPINTNYTITVTGAGYRTARYNVVLSEDKTVKFWNNVMDNVRAMEIATKGIGDESDPADDAADDVPAPESEATLNFLAGDIVEDNNINIYDLSAVVSYFNTAAEDKTSAFDYIQYDLNRDGIIDSKDVAYVLVSWGN